MAGMRLTARDRQMAAWLERLALVEASQLGRRFGLGRTQAYRRLRAMGRAGLVRHERVWHGRPGCYLATGRRVPIRTYEHALAVTDLVIDRELAGDRTITERELRAAAARGLAPAEDFDGGAIATGLKTQHFPDLVTIERKGAIAWEVERRSKGRERLIAILAGYAHANHYREVRYLVAGEQLARLVTEAAASAGAGNVRVEVVPS